MIVDLRKSIKISPLGKRIMVWSAPFATFVILCSLLLLIPVIMTQLGASQYPNNASQATGLFRIAGFVNIVERFKSPYNIATSLSEQKKYEEAYHKFEEAYALATDKQDRCLVVYNAVLNQEKWGDMSKTADEAIPRYISALAQIDKDSGCFENTIIRLRIEAKLDAARNGKGSEKPSDQEEESTEDLEQKIQQSRQESSQHQRENKTMNNTEINDYSGRRW